MCGTCCFLNYTAESGSVPGASTLFVWLLLGWMLLETVVGWRTILCLSWMIYVFLCLYRQRPPEESQLYLSTCPLLLHNVSTSPRFPLLPPHRHYTQPYDPIPTHGGAHSERHWSKGGQLKAVRQSLWHSFPILQTNNHLKLPGLKEWK